MAHSIITRQTAPEASYSGRVIIADNFHTGAAVWQPMAPYPASSLYWQGIYQLSAGKSLCISDGNRVPVTGTESYGRRQTGAVTSGKVAIEINFLYPSTDTEELVFILDNVANERAGTYYGQPFYGQPLYGGGRVQKRLD